MFWWIILFVVLCLIGFYLSTLSYGEKSTFAPNKFQSRPFMTPNELEFLGRLEKAIPELRFHAQVSMGALLNPTANRYQKGSGYLAARNNFDRKIIDYVGQCRHTGNIIVVIELDDRTHNTQKDVARDAMLHQAGYLTVRWNSRKKPDSDSIRQHVFDEYAKWLNMKQG